MDPVKEAFQKIKEEMSFLRNEILNLSVEINKLKNSSLQNQTSPAQNQTVIYQPTDTPTHIPTVPQEIRGSYVPENDISTGNRGVPTDTLTDKQTIRQTDILSTFEPKIEKTLSIENIQETLNSLDNLKKEIRLKFKRLTSQEMLVFSTIYTLESKGLEEITYKTIASSLNLSESSIRDYVIKLSAKGIPIVKQRLNNKQIVLKISPNLQKIASLSTIVKLREL
jgi:hypothetical protein